MIYIYHALHSYNVNNGCNWPQWAQWVEWAQWAQWAHARPCARCALARAHAMVDTLRGKGVTNVQIKSDTLLHNSKHLVHPFPNTHIAKKLNENTRKTHLDEFTYVYTYVDDEHALKDLNYAYSKWD